MIVHAQYSTLTLVWLKAMKRGEMVITLEIPILEVTTLIPICYRSYSYTTAQ